EAAEAVSDAISATLGPEDWLEAFSAHPRIGGAERAGRAGTDQWSRHEQAGVTDASRAPFERLNHAYEARFGNIFIVCATGKSAADLLRILERRLANDPARELQAAADEQRQITRIRLAKLLT